MHTDAVDDHLASCVQTDGNIIVDGGGGIVLVVISMLLTIIAGLIPSKKASKKDPVEALRSE